MTSTPNPIVVPLTVSSDAETVELMASSDAEAVALGSSTELRPMPNITIGNVETLGTGEPATAAMSGTYQNPILNLGLPRGARGETGKDGDSYTVEVVGETLVFTTKRGE